MTGLLAAWLGGAEAARGLPVEVVFEGTLGSVEGSVPGGPVAEGAPFEGTLVYDPDRPAGVGAKAYYVFDDGAAALSLSLAGVSYATDPNDPWVSIGVWNDVIVSRFNPDLEIDPADPEAVMRDSFGVGSLNNVPVGGTHYEISMDVLEISEDWPAELLDSVALPSSSAWLAPRLVGAEVIVRGSGTDDFELVGTVTSAAPIPEPSTAALVWAGLALLAALRSRV